MKNKPLVIYHDNCADGYGAAFSAWYQFGPTAEYLPAKYGADQKWPKSTADSEINVAYWLDRQIYILDFSLPKESMDFIFAHCERVVWLDHHKTSFEMAGCDAGITLMESSSWPPGSKSDRHKIVLDNSKSGALLSWEHFNPDEPVPQFIKMISDRDLWKFEIANSKALHSALLAERPWVFGKFMNLMNPLHLQKKIAEGQLLLRAEEKMVRQVVNDMFLIEISSGAESWCCNVVNSPLLQSEIGNYASSAISNKPVIVWCMKQLDNGEIVVNCSLRSKGDVDVSAIAKRFGGGGHKNAAGFQVSQATFFHWMRSSTDLTYED